MFKIVRIKDSILRGNTRLKHVWQKPDCGYDTNIKIYNCITRKKEPLIVWNKNLVTWYTCGPTVYDSAHIGHASCYVKLDILQRILKDYFKLNLITVMNITDIDDKIIARSRTKKISTEELAKHYEKEFWEDLDSINVTRPNIILKVTENMDKIKEFIEVLVRSDKAYVGGDKSVYFDVSKCNNYGKLQNIGEGAEAQSKHKRSPQDFAVWKAAKEGEVFWESPWGPGRPGWHIECSALATHALGRNIDIHAGGIDLRFPHHENEEAQSCGYHCSNQWVNYWIHTGHLHLKESEKMSKSLKNTILIQDMLKSTKLQSFRMACAMTHYRSGMEFSEQFMQTAEGVFKHFKNFTNTCEIYLNKQLNLSISNEKLINLLNECDENIYMAMCDDFNTPEIINILNKLVSSVNSELHLTGNCDSQQSGANIATLTAIYNLVVKTLSLFGVDVVEERFKSNNFNQLTDVIDILSNFRQEIRLLAISNKDKNVLKLCDSVREDLKKTGIVLKDHGKISSWSR